MVDDARISMKMADSSLEGVTMTVLCEAEARRGSSYDALLELGEPMLQWQRWNIVESRVHHVVPVTVTSEPVLLVAAAVPTDAIPSVLLWVSKTSFRKMYIRLVFGDIIHRLGSRSLSFAHSTSKISSATRALISQHVAHITWKLSCLDSFDLPCTDPLSLSVLGFSDISLSST